MFDGLVWTTVEVRPLWAKDGYLNWIVLERHRITGAMRTTHVHEEFVHAAEFSRSDAQAGEPS